MFNCKKEDSYIVGYNSGLEAFKEAILSVPMKKREKKDLESSLTMIFNMLKR